ncbi:hypothetical protein EIN_220060 [Entamoeba invadens IP1]|uniref:CCHC-type domain-containing protein n=1 Tax=Entamoeba invadens IP1 TaxID=370355 RepID=L7FP18_ENTIV|nr:hypothetical protein EIN_220060 [Entamoeba invadens IP1]ELP89544.1 hypothetical protein EIN_220060 [Entamoeba invadens IP1]|eukprot:XP_004256315.1 hypothetical protein EIN_220060 [Entamoeba invadens IP1]
MSTDATKSVTSKVTKTPNADLPKSTQTEPASYFINLRGFDKSTTDDVVKSLCDEFHPLCYDIQHFDKDVKFNTYLIETESPEAAQTLVERRNKKSWKHHTLSLSVEPSDTTKRFVKAQGLPPRVTDEMLNDYFKNLGVKSIKKNEAKVGELKGNVYLGFKDLETAKNVMISIAKKLESMGVRASCCNKNKNELGLCFICGEFGHPAFRCPLKKSEEMKIEKKEQKKVVEQKPFEREKKQPKKKREGKSQKKTGMDE